MSNPSGSNSSRNGLIGAHGLPNLAQIPNISALHGLLANGLRHPFNNPHRQSISVEPPSRESNSSAEDSGQFSPSESKKMEEKTSPLAPNSWQNTPTKSHISQLEEQHRDINHNVQNATCWNWEVRLFSFHMCGYINRMALKRHGKTGASKI